MRIRRSLTVVALVGFVALMLLPLYSMVVLASSPDDSDLSGLRFHGFALFDNLGQIMTDGRFPRYLLNSVVIASAVSVLDVAISAAAGYALARLRFPGRAALLNLVIIALSLTPAVVMIPVFVALSELGWLNSYQGLIAPFVASALGVFLVRQFALGIPAQMLHAARVDGAGELRIFFLIAVPLLRPALLTVLLLQFLAQWDNLIWPLIAASEQELWTLPLALSSFEGEHGIVYHLQTAAALLSILPPLVLFALLQRYYVSGLTLGGVKR
ncbi:carbohydrate ABC transporter permease [Nonomuraea sp. NPDC050451]|uniref:carbohydrate ABC transporter permease n=1 Tax=Nonomuraea sp. NPDC050451 TaxID=3364364 RepID=UPI00379B48EF